MAEKMTFTEAVSAMPWQKTGETLVVEGVGGFGGFALAGIVGRQIQNRIKKDPASGGFTTITDKLTAWSANNIPKIAVWYLLRKFGEGQEGLAQTGIVDASKATAVSIGFDTVVRLTHGGTNPGTVKIFNYEILGGESNSQHEVQSSRNMAADKQRLIQENSALRSELNKALQRLTTPVVPMYTAPTVHIQPPIVQVQQPPIVQVRQVETVPPVIPIQIQYTPPEVEEREKRYGFADGAQPIPPTVQERERKYGFMDGVTLPVVQERQKKYGFMGNGEEEKNIATMFGML